MYDRIRLIIASVILLLILLIHFPLQTFTMLCAIAVAYFIIKSIPKSKEYKNDMLFDNQKIRSRQEALNSAKLYLAPYTDIWKNLRLTNNYIVIRLDSTEIGINAKELQQSQRSLKVVHSAVHPMDDVWNTICLKFSHQMSFDGLKELLDRYEVKYFVTGETEQETIRQNTDNNQNIRFIIPEEQTDINNASEEEISKLPGISIILAKKIVKRRSETGGFKNSKELFSYIKVNSHIQKQLEPLIKFDKIKNDGSVHKTQERRVDL